MTAEKETRINEWFVPRFGPKKFRIFVGLLFLPYTGMCVSFAVLGSISAGTVAWDRVGGIALIYFLALGVSAHAADSIGSKRVKPWGRNFSKRELALLAACTLAAAYAIGIYYIVYFVPLLAPIAALEGFFLLAYNLELFGGRFHNNFWFAVSWGVLPALAGYIMQTNSLGIVAAAVASCTGLASYAEIRLSRPYKELARNGRDPGRARKLERQLKVLSLVTIALTCCLVASRIVFS